MKQLKLTASLVIFLRSCSFPHLSDSGSLPSRFRLPSEEVAFENYVGCSDGFGFWSESIYP